mgnify:CR=1 FL=1
MTAKARNALTALLALIVVGAIVGLFLTGLPASSPAKDSAPAANSGLLPGQNLEAMLSERAMGVADAPVTIVENSSLSCPHCAHFHADVLPKLKTEYIDTGKVRLILNDFPLNRPALEGAILARCLPEDRYFPFVDLAFSTQKSLSLIHI